MTNADHFDQLSPIDGMQVQPDGTVQPVSPPPNPVVEQDETERPGAAPSLPPQHAEAMSAQGEQLQQAILDQVDAQRAQLAQPAGNIGGDGAPHFQRLLPDGAEVCGQDGQPWPCEEARGIAEAARRTEFGTMPVGEIAADGSPQLLTFEEAARAAGVNPEQFAAQVQRLRRT